MSHFPLYAKAKGFDSGQIGLLLGAVAFSLFIFGIPITRLGASGYSRAPAHLVPSLVPPELLLFSPHRRTCSS